MNTNEVFYFLMNHVCIYCDNCGNELIYRDISYRTGLFKDTNIIVVLKRLMLPV